MMIAPRGLGGHLWPRSELPLAHDVLRATLQYAIAEARTWALLRQVCTQFQRCLDEPGVLDHVSLTVRVGGGRQGPSLETVAASRCAASVRRMTLILHRSLGSYEAHLAMGGRSLASFGSLQRLTLRDVTDSRLLALELTTTAETLLSLRVPDAGRVSIVGLDWLTQFKQLQDLQLGWLQCPLVGVTLEGELNSTLPQFTALQHLSLPECRFLDADTLQALHAEGTLTSLQCLDLTGCELVDDGCLLVVSRLAKLSKLCLDRCELITDVGLHALSVMAGLHELKMNDLDLVTDAGLSALALSLPALRVLEVHLCSRTTHGASHDAQLGALGHDALRKRGLHVVCHHPRLRGGQLLEASCNTALATEGRIYKMRKYI